MCAAGWLAGATPIEAEYQFSVLGQLRKLHIVAGQVYADFGKSCTIFEVGDETVLGRVARVLESGVFLELPKGVSVSQALGAKIDGEPGSGLKFPSGTKIYPLLEENSGDPPHVVTEDLLIAASNENTAKALAKKVGAGRVRPSEAEGWWLISVEDPARILPAAVELQQAGVEVQPQLKYQMSKKRKR
jgi:hypothetical protein